MGSSARKFVLADALLLQIKLHELHILNMARQRSASIVVLESGAWEINYEVAYAKLKKFINASINSSCLDRVFLISVTGAAIIYIYLAFAFKSIF